MSINKLGFHLMWVLLILFAVGPALAQYTSTHPVAGTIASANLNHNLERIGNQTPSSNNTQNLGKGGFVVYEKPDNTNKRNGIETHAASGAPPGAVVQIVAASTGDVRFPDIRELLSNGGTIELAIKQGPAPTFASRYQYATVKLHSLVISEIMWGMDASATGLHQGVTNRALQQWIEIYNHDADFKYLDKVRLVFSPNRWVIRDEIIFRVATGATDISDGIHTPHANNVPVTYKVVDRVTLINRLGVNWDLKGSSGNTRVVRSGGIEIPPTDLVSMYRKINLDGDKYKVKDNALDGLGPGSEPGSWEKSGARINMSDTFIGSPGSVHVFQGGIAGIAKNYPKTPASIGSTGVILNEVRNDTSEANLDWVELYYNNDAAGATPQNIENWTLSLVMRTPKEGKKETDDPTGTNFTYTDENLFSLPKYKLQPGEYLVVYNRTPRNTDLAGGVNIEDVVAGKQVNKGSSHLYVVRKGLKLPSNKKFMLVLRNGNDKAGTHEKIVDYAGNAFENKNSVRGLERVETNQFNTEVWPFIGWTAPGDVEPFGDNTFASATQSFGRVTELTDKGMYRPKSRNDNRTHKDDWQAFGFTGTGYDRDVDRRTSPGTPGYPNYSVNIVKDDREGAANKSAYAFGGTITISEIMYDAGPRWNLVQWIELYNSSQTETINLAGWTMEIRNKSTNIESYVDSSFRFKDNTYILPNQTLLLVSGHGANEVPDERVYNLGQDHRRELGLTARDSRLLSREGFYIRLTSKIMEDGLEKDIDDLNATEISEILMDEAGNLEVKGAARNQMWKLPDRDPDIRKSLVRQYGSRALDGSRDMADDGTMEASWRQADLSGAALTFYGHRNDIGTPGFRLGGPLPVSLSSFRPVRDDATGHVVVRWITQSELNNAGFNILRSESKTGEFTVVNVKGIVPGHGTTSEKHVYEWTDTTAKPNVVYYYQIEDVSLDGKRTLLTTTRLKGHVSASGKVTTTWANLKHQD